MTMLGIVGILVVGFTGSAAASHTGLLYGAPNRVTITMTEYKFIPNTITIQAGEAVDVVLEYKGVLPHVFMVYPKPRSRL